MTAEQLTQITDSAEPYDEITLFKVSAWSASVPADTWWIPQLADDIVESIRADPMDPVGLSALRTKPTLSTRTEKHWVEFFSFMRRAFDSILRTAPELRYQQFGMRAWGVLIDSDTWKKDLEHGPARIVETHNHTPAVFTSVFACELPTYPVAEDLATVFHNPAKHMICPWQPRVVLVPPAVGRALIFPGWVEHSAPVVMPIAEGQRRVIISTDYFPEHTNSAFDPARQAGLPS
jgi:hypothetical protein